MLTTSASHRGRHVIIARCWFGRATQVPRARRRNSGASSAACSNRPLVLKQIGISLITLNHKINLFRSARFQFVFLSSDPDGDKDHCLRATIVVLNVLAMFGTSWWRTSSMFKSWNKRFDDFRGLIRCWSNVARATRAKWISVGSALDQLQLFSWNS